MFNESLYYMLYSCINPIFLKKCGAWDMSQDVFGQSDCRIFESTISLEQKDEIAWFFAGWYKFMAIKSWLKNIGVDVGKKWHSDYRILKLPVSQRINGKNWFFAWWYKFRKAKK